MEHREVFAICFWKKKGLKGKRKTFCKRCPFPFLAIFLLFVFGNAVETDEIIRCVDVDNSCAGRSTPLF